MIPGKKNRESARKKGMEYRHHAKAQRTGDKEQDATQVQGLQPKDQDNGMHQQPEKRDQGGQPGRASVSPKRWAPDNWVAGR